MCRLIFHLEVHKQVAHWLPGDKLFNDVEMRSTMPSFGDLCRIFHNDLYISVMVGMWRCCLCRTVFVVPLPLLLVRYIT